MLLKLLTPVRVKEKEKEVMSRKRPAKMLTLRYDDDDDDANVDDASLKSGTEKRRYSVPLLMT